MTKPAHSDEGSDPWYLTGGGLGAQMMRYHVRMRALEAMSKRINNKIEEAMEVSDDH